MKENEGNYFCWELIYLNIPSSYTNLDASGEFVIAIDMDGGKFSDFVELKLDLDRLVATIVSPAYPALGTIVIVVHFEIIRSCSAIRQLT